MSGKDERERLARLEHKTKAGTLPGAKRARFSRAECEVLYRLLAALREREPMRWACAQCRGMFEAADLTTVSADPNSATLCWRCAEAEPQPEREPDGWEMWEELRHYDGTRMLRVGPDFVDEDERWTPVLIPDENRRVSAMLSAALEPVTPPQDPEATP